MTGFAGKAPVYSLGNLGSCPCLATENGTDKLTMGQSSCFWLLWISFCGYWSLPVQLNLPLGCEVLLRLIFGELWQISGFFLSVWFTPPFWQGWPVARGQLCWGSPEEGWGKVPIGWTPNPDLHQPLGSLPQLPFLCCPQQPWGQGGFGKRCWYYVRSLWSPVVPAMEGGWGTAFGKAIWNAPPKGL